MRYRGIVIVHGVGSTRKGSYIDSFAEPLAAYVGTSLGFDNVSLDVNHEPDGGGQTWATLCLGTRGTETDETWHIREAWWTESFRASKPQSVLFWGVIAGLTLLWSSFKNVVFRPFLRFVAAGWYYSLSVGQTDKYGRPLANGMEADEANQGVWTLARAPFWKRLIDALMWTTLVAFYLLVAVALVVIVVPIYIFLLTPLSFVLPKQVAAVSRKILSILLSTVGDQQALTTRMFALASASHQVERALWTMLSAEGLRHRAREAPGFTGSETVTVVAHSGGAVVSYDALAGDALGRWQGEELPDGLRRPARLNWFTAGSGLNLAFNMHRRKHPQDIAFWRRIDGFVNWVNVYARYDPIPQGPAPRGLVDRVMGEDRRATEPHAANLPPRPPYVCLRVVNTDFPADDHFGYWDNHDEVLSRLVHVICDDRLASEPLDPDRCEFRSTGFAPLDDGIRSSVAAGRAHRTRVLMQHVPLYLALGLFVTAVFTIGRELGEWLVGNREFWGMAPVNISGRTLEGILPRKVGPISVAGYRDGLAGALVLAFVLTVAGQLASLFGSLGQWVRDGGSLLYVVIPAAGLIVGVGGFTLLVLVN